MKRPNILIVIACVKTKKGSKGFRAPACEMYDSRLFRLCWGQATEDAQPIAIVSARYGLIQPNQVIEWYDEWIDSMSSEEITKWKHLVEEQLDRDFKDVNQVIFLASPKYRNPLRPIFEAREIEVRIHTKWNEITKEAFS